MSSVTDTSLSLTSSLPPTPPPSSGTSTISDSSTIEIENGEMALAARFINAFERLVEERLSDNHQTDVGDAGAQGKKSHAGRATTLAYKHVEEAWDDKAHKYKIVEATQSGAGGLDQYVFVARDRIDRTTKEKTTFIDIKSAILRDVLREGCRDFRSISLAGDTPSLDLKVIFHLRSFLRCRRDTAVTAQDTLSQRHLSLLVAYVEAAFESTDKQLCGLIQRNEITYALLWALFEPNIKVFTTCPGTDAPRCVLYNHYEEREELDGSKFFRLETRFLGTNGKFFGESTTRTKIPFFRGAKRIDFLPAYPLQYHWDYDGITQELIENGRRFISLAGIHHRQYKGTAFYVDDEGDIVKRHVDGRIMVDGVGFQEQNPGHPQSVVRKINPRQSTPTPTGTVNTSLQPSASHPFDFQAPCLYDQPCDGVKMPPVPSVSHPLEFQAPCLYDRPFDGVSPLPSVSHLPDFQAPSSDWTGLLSSDSKELENEDLLICGPTVLGFCLSRKAFLEFAVGHIRDIPWSPSSYDNVKLPEAQKKPIWALTQTYCSRDEDPTFRDFVQGKGRGINFLLYGPPGVGKTLTAETIAESCKLPLYTVAAGQIGVDPVRVESFLTTTFKIASRWKAILLIDEADVFLAQRSDNPQINALVSVFLRELEQFDGVLFLTTNRVQSFDEAMISRIHLALKYQPLDEEARKAVWKHFLDQAATSRGSPDAAKLADELADTVLNGREIRNTVFAAWSIAEYEGTVVQLSHLEDSIHAREQFQHDFHGAGVVENLHSYF
ncbi:hypothetical protein BHE90_017007 [Fusarium euwallaceae]|uniref:AAA+ ATPase domain-containing protein n=1 Tax=Fusarium euwallaceae TaxID=1147111 RepID=A0A430KYS7_9HYPO|nr:hypothetical protein BHE90_017007 [Fusarium euwallaceae]